jgi:hypothetical protein
MTLAESEKAARALHLSGDPACGEFRCAGCGYGVSVRRVLPPRCPMCGGEEWDEALERRRSASPAQPPA